MRTEPTSIDARSHPSRGQTVLVTGAASGIGLATVRTLRDRGADLIAYDIDPAVDALAEAFEDEEPREIPEQRFVSGRGDVADGDALDALLDATLGRTGSLDAVVHCAAVSVGGTALTTSLEDWNRVMSVNLTGAFTVAATTIPRLIPSAGSLVLVASQLGMVGARSSVAYSSSKGGVINLMRSLALDHGPQGVRVNCLCPGPTETPFLLDSFRRAADPDEARTASLSKIPLGRFGTSDEIARGAAFLASRESSFVHGTTLVVDGGYLAG